MTLILRNCKIFPSQFFLLRDMIKKIVGLILALLKIKDAVMNEKTFKGMLFRIVKITKYRVITKQSSQSSAMTHQKCVVLYYCAKQDGQWM